MKDLQPSAAVAKATLAGPTPASPTTAELWKSLRHLTQARIAVGRSGDSLPTTAVMQFETAQARARDAVHLAMDVASITASIAALGLDPVYLQSSAPDRATYLRRPDQGRCLAEASRQLLASLQLTPPNSLCVVVGDGLSAAAPLRHAAPLLRALQQIGLRMDNPVFITTQARVALGDEIGERMHADAVLVLLGERPGLSTPDSLGAYLTWAPRVGRTDAERNCVSNIHGNGLGYAEAAHKLAYLLQQARQLGLTGVQLHDNAGEHDRALPSKIKNNV